MFLLTYKIFFSFLCILLSVYYAHFLCIYTATLFDLSSFFDKLLIFEMNLSLSISTARAECTFFSLPPRTLRGKSRRNSLKLPNSRRRRGDRILLIAALFYWKTDVFWFSAILRDFSRQFCKSK